MGSRDRNGYLADCDVGLGLKMQLNQNQQVDDDGGGGGGGGFAGGGSFAALMMMGSSTGNQSQVAMPMYDVFVNPPAAAAASYGITDQQRPSFVHPFSLKSLGGLGQDTGARAPPATTFTASQRQELERQTVIYKLITASVPVPSELVLPKSNPIFPAAAHHLINGAISGRNNNNRIGGSIRNGNGDAEPWRCRRTDGKKWRCSRDVAPDQKYCERHSHKGRPSTRSRKHVESSFSTTTKLSSSHSQSNPYSRPDLSTSSAADNIATTSASPTGFNFIKSPIYDDRQKTTSFLDQNTSSMVLPHHHQQQQLQYHHPYHYNHTSRFPEWYMEKEGHHHTHIDDAGAAVTMIAPPSYSSCSHLDQMGPQTASDSTSCLLPRQFLDAWSSVGIEKNGSPGGTTIQDISAKPNGADLLTLSMSGMESRSAGEDTAQLGIGLLESERFPCHADSGVGGRGSNEPGYSWMSPSPPGGPLAEALCLGIAGGSVSSNGPTTTTTPASSSCSR